MSRLKEALVFKTDKDRLEWFQSLTPEEQADVVKDIKEFMEIFEKALEPILNAVKGWVDNFVPVMTEVAAKNPPAIDQFACPSCGGLRFVNTVECVSCGWNSPSPSESRSPGH